MRVVRPYDFDFCLSEGQRLRREDLPRDLILRSTSLPSDEEPLLACFQGPSEWYLVTTFRLVWKREELQKALAWEDVHGVKPPAATFKAVALEEIDKMEMEELEIFDPEDVKYVLRLEAGQAYFILWNVILALCNRFLHPPEMPVLERTRNPDSQGDEPIHDSESEKPRAKL